MAAVARPKSWGSWMGPASKDTLIEINSDEVKKDEDTKEEMDAALREGLRRSMRHTRGSQSPEPEGEAKSSSWRGDSRSHPTSPTKKARVRLEEDGQGGDGFGTPTGSIADEIEETARYSPAYAAETPRAPDGEEELPDEDMGADQGKKIPEVAGQPAATGTPGTPTPTTAPTNDQFLMQINTSMETLFAKSNQLMIDSTKNLQVNMDAKWRARKRR